MDFIPKNSLLIIIENDGMIVGITGFVAYNIKSVHFLTAIKIGPGEKITPFNTDQSINIKGKQVYSSDQKKYIQTN